MKTWWTMEDERKTKKPSCVLQGKENN